jgi:xanthine dehydrogenase accessory factor
VNVLSELLSHLALQPAMLVTVQAARGSVPREAGTWMAVFPTFTLATIGGGRLEFDATQHARGLLTQGALAPQTVRYPVGPRLGQCCGGEVHLRFERVTQGDAATLTSRLATPRVPVALFGGGHVGAALASVLGTLPMAVRWLDSRDEVFPSHLPDNVECENSDPVQAAVATLQPQSRILIMSFSHAEDLDILMACLLRQRSRGDLPYIGMIGSKTKWATFSRRLRERGFSPEELAHVTCPIGIQGINDKRPEVIAVSVAAQLLLMGGLNAPAPGAEFAVTHLIEEV